MFLCEHSLVRSTVFAGRIHRTSLQSEDTRLKTQEVSTDNSIDWKYIQANIRCKAWRGYKAGAYGRQELRDIEQSLWTMVERYLADFTPERATFKTLTVATFRANSAATTATFIWLGKCRRRMMRDVSTRTGHIESNRSDSRCSVANRC